MPNYKSPGTENLRARPKVKFAAPPTSPGGGTAAGGTDNPRAQHKVKSTPPPAAGARGGYDHKVPGVQTFTDGTV